jgi:hypothetical protein
MQKIRVNTEMEERIRGRFDLSNAQKRTIITEISKPGNEAYILSFKSRFSLEDEKYVKEALGIVISGNIHLRIKQDEDMNFMQYYAPRLRRRPFHLYCSRAFRPRTYMRGPATLRWNSPVTSLLPSCG